MRKNIEAICGDTYQHVVRWANPDLLVWKAITGATKAAPCVLTVASHGLTAGWPFKIFSVVGMDQLNQSEENGLGANDEEFYEATVPTSGTIELNDVNSLDFDTYVSGGAICYEAARSLSGYTAKFQVKDSINGTALVSLTESSGITIDDTAKTITVVLSAANTLAIGEGKYPYDLEMTLSGVKTTILRGFITILPQVST